MEMVIKYKAVEEEVHIHLVTISNDQDPNGQIEKFEQIRNVVQNAGIKFTWEFDADGTIHARHIVTDTGWKISLDRGLDIFQHYEMNNSLDLTNRLQEFRSCKAFEVTYLKMDGRNERG
jgi:ATP-dependent Lon protease